MSSDSLSALDLAIREFRSQLVGVGDGDWTAATPCTDWDVRYLVAHVVGGNRFASMVLAGRGAVDAAEAVMGARQLGENPLGDFDDSASAQRAAFHGPGALDGLVDHPTGPVEGERFLRMRVFDIALHAWDLGTAMGRGMALDARLVAHVLQTVETEEDGMGFGIERCGAVGPDATPQERLLDLTGRCSHQLHA